MIPTDSQIPWFQFPVEFLIYFVGMGILFLPVFLLTCTGLAFLRGATPGWLSVKIRRLALFMGLLLLAGSIFNGLWSCLIWGHLYWSADYLLDFTPFFPVTQGRVEFPFGDVRGSLLGKTT